MQSPVARRRGGGEGDVEPWDGEPGLGGGSVMASARGGTVVGRGARGDGDERKKMGNGEMPAQEGGNGFVWLVVCFGAIGGVLFGMDQANFAGVETKKSFINSFCNVETQSSGSWGSYDECLGRAKLSDGTEKAVPVPDGFTNFEAWASSLIQLGAAAGCVLLAPLITRTLGRRAGLCIGCLIVLVGMAACVSTNDISFFYAARFLAGVGIGTVTFALPMWTSELAPAHIRGVLGCTMQMAVVIGSQIAAGINVPENVTWQISLAAPILPAALVMCFIFCFPESPRFLLRRHGRESAEKALRRLRSGSEDAIREEMAGLERTLQQESEEMPWSVLFTDPSIRRRVLIANMLQWMQQFTGINTLLGQGPKLYSAAGLAIDPNVAGFITSFFSLVGTAIMMVVIDRLGRRPLLLVGSTGMFCFMSVSGVLAWHFSDSVLAGMGLLVSCCLYMFSFAVAWGGIPWVYPSEIFPMDVKEKALSTSVFSQWIGNFLIAQISPRQIDRWGVGPTFFFYSATIVLGFFLVFNYVPETRGVPIQDMDHIFGERRYLRLKSEEAIDAELQADE